MSGAAGSVALVGAGPGDPNLLTVKARRRLDEADVILHDALVTPELLGTCPDSAEIVDVGKRPNSNGGRLTQAEINRLLVRATRGGRDVVRLKGGDPYVFGRGGEEAEFLAAAGVDVEVVPGLTSAVTAPAVAGIPVTHRDHASCLTVVTGHEDPTKAESALDWAALADTVAAGGTLVVLMGVGRLPETVATLRDHEVAADTPVAMVEKATWDAEYTLTGTLSTIVERAVDVGIEPPAVTVVGDVVDVRERVIDASQSVPARECADGTAGRLRSDGGSR
ncbi:uroporphyrin-III C-methyltransferase [Halovivax asiaticus JCM 14624]|uniref:uroporphyrinogen-III C-methyltransferase n=1 Tax=Halovivax asiaticus JCM 14624 TaxID=1227490 RepID=M0BNB1_9EURY|nr:uroporphyrinogen-III C-methyltransferase [Halovivax asiaticus]ELZ11962.1 uroporphyrin-III C-methyltransferase [Halovivax asiaticus JCM 14624]